MDELSPPDDDELLSELSPPLLKEERLSGSGVDIRLDRKLRSGSGDGVGVRWRRRSGMGVGVR